jgi:hypothetical protein
MHSGVWTSLREVSVFIDVGRAAAISQMYLLQEKYTHLTVAKLSHMFLTLNSSSYTHCALSIRRQARGKIVGHQCRGRPRFLSTSSNISILRSPTFADGKNIMCHQNTCFEEKWWVNCIHSQCIIDLGEGSGEPEQHWLMAADVDPKESQLTFNLCLIPRFTLEQYPAPIVYVPPADIHIYRLTLNGHGGGAMLTANKIKTLRNGFRAASAKSDLRGRYLARSLRVLEPTSSSSIEVCDWVQSDDSTHMKLHIALGSAIPVRPSSHLLSSFSQHMT